ncbi:MAG: PP2C family protein-serine/threonine phosphatase [Opitutales bacterium]
MPWTFAGLTDQGRVRPKNEDALLINPERQLFAVADGLGGLPRGSLASSLAVDHLNALVMRDPAEQSADLNRIFLEVNRLVCSKGFEISEETGIGTTLTAVQINDDRLTIGHAGDSALIAFRTDGWDQLTSDHTMAEEIRSRLKPGEDAYIPDYFHHTLTRCIGQTDELDIDTEEHIWRSGERFLICSDGVTKVFEPDELQAAIFEKSDPEELVHWIIDTGNERGGPDNITAIVLFPPDA